MRRFIVLLLITGTVWAQTGLDKLVLDDRTEFLGEYSGVMENLVYFKPAKALAFQGVPINRIRSLQLGDGKTIIQDEYIKIRTILDYKHLSIKDKAIYDAKKDARRWLLYPSFAILLTGVSIHSYFYFFWDEGPEGDTSLNNILSVATATSALVGSHHLFSKSDKSNIEGIISKDIELYKEMYYKQFKKQKLKNIMISAVATALIAGAVTIHVLSNLSFGDDYDVCFDPRC